MTIIKKVVFHKSFLEGRLDSATATDMAIMTPDEVQRMSDWLVNVISGKSHVGANKPSWMANGAFVPGTELYRDCNIWHYHCGPYKKADGTKLTDNTFNANYDGRHSGPVYHYAKQGDTIIVLGFSRMHNPFPLVRSKKNPLGARGTTLDQVAEL